MASPRLTLVHGGDAALEGAPGQQDELELLRLMVEKLSQRIAVLEGEKGVHAPGTLETRHASFRRVLAEWATDPYEPQPNHAEPEEKGA